MRTGSKKSILIVLLLGILLFPGVNVAYAAKTYSLFNQNLKDTDTDGWADWKEKHLSSTDYYQTDTDRDGTSDYNELMNGTDPNSTDNKKLSKHIYISIKHQELRYYTGPYLVDDFLVSTGIPGKDTPLGEFGVLKKVPVMLYQGPDYYLPNTKWNLMFKPTYYIHGAYWHSNFGNKMSHGCVNVSYADVQQIYNWAEVGTAVTILGGDFPQTLAMDLPSNSLIVDDKTIYLIMDGKKSGFTSMPVFSGLGYSLGNVKKRSTSGIEPGPILDDAGMAHLPGSWIINGRTVYYVTDQGIIPIPTWEVFISNGGAGWQLVSANSNDLNKSLLVPMIAGDPRVKI